MASITRRIPRRRTGVLAALGAFAVLALAGSSPAFADPVAVQSGTLTWNIAHESGPSTGTLSNYSTAALYGASAGNGFTTSGGATGSITAAPQTPAAGAAGSGNKVAFTFPAAATAGTFDVDKWAAPGGTQFGTINFAGTLTVTAHGQTFWTVVDPKLSFDARQSVRLIGGGEITPPQGSPEGTPNTTIPSTQTIYSLDATAAVTTTNPDGSITISNLVPSASTTDANNTAFAVGTKSWLSKSPLFDPIRTWFLAPPESAARPSDSISVTFKPQGSGPQEPEEPPVVDPPAGDAKGLGVHGGVESSVSLSLVQSTADLGTFLPGVAATHDQTISATATATVPSTLTVYDPASANHPGFLVNGSTPLASPLKVAATNAAFPTASYGSLSGSPLTLLSWASPVSSGAFTIRLRQEIGATEPLSAGTYGKTLTVTLSAASA
jgi:hypothetical protein